MDFQKIKQLLNKEDEGTEINCLTISMEERLKLRDMVLNIREFQNLRKQIGGDNKIFDECLNALRYEFYPKNSLVLYSGQKRESFQFILQGSCGTFSPKEDSYINKEIKYFGNVQELQTLLKKQQAKLEASTNIQEEQTASFNIKNLEQKIQNAEATLFVYRKEGDQQRLKEAILHVEDKQLRSKLYQKHFQLNTLCLYSKEKSLISGDTIESININGKEIKNTTITLEDCHIISININDYLRIFQHIIKQIYQSQRIMRSYFPDLNEETLQMLSYEFATQYYERNEVIYHQNAQNPCSFFILLSGSIEIRKYIDKNKKQQQQYTNNQKLQSSGKSKNVISQHQLSFERNNSSDQINQEIDQLNNNNSSSDDSPICRESCQQNENLSPTKIEEQKEQHKLFNSNDSYHSIMIFSGQQVFGTECYSKINEYSAVSVSTETKVIVLDKKKFELYDHQFNFKAFLKKQAGIQNKFYEERLSKLQEFSQKMIDQQMKSRQLIFTQVKQAEMIKNSSSPFLENTRSNFSLKQPNPKMSKNQGDQIQNIESSVNLFDFQQKVSQQTILQNLFQSQNGKKITFKDLIQKLVSRNSDRKKETTIKEEENSEQQINNNEEQELPYHEMERKSSKRQSNRSVEHNKGFEFELNEDKRRRTNILIDFKVKSKLNYKSLPRKQPEEPSTPLKQDSQKSTSSNSLKIKVKQQYVQRQGQFPWLDQFGYRKEMEGNSNGMNILQLESKMRNQEEIIRSRSKRNSFDGSPVNTTRKRLSSVEKQTIPDNLNIPTLIDIQQINEKPLTQSHKSYVNLDVTNKQILKIKSNINIMKEQDQQEQEQIQSIQKMFSSNRIYKNSQSESRVSPLSQQRNQEIQTNLTQPSIANLLSENKSPSHVYHSFSQNHIQVNLTSPSSKRITLSPIITPDKFIKQYKNRELMRRTKKLNSVIVRTQSLENPFKQLNKSQSSYHIKLLNEVSSTREIQINYQQINSPVQTSKTTRAQSSLHVEPPKKEVPQIELQTSQRFIKTQVNLLKKRNLIAENFAPSINTKLNFSQKNDNSPSNHNCVHLPISTERFFIDSPTSQFKRYSENINSLNSPSSLRTTFFRQQSQEQPSPLNNGSQIVNQPKSIHFKTKVSNFLKQ